MTHVDLIEKLLKYAQRLKRFLFSTQTQIAKLLSRYTPDGRNEKKQRLNELA